MTGVLAGPAAVCLQVNRSTSLSPTALSPTDRQERRARHSAGAAYILVRWEAAASACKDSPTSPLGLLTLLSLGPSGQAAGSSRLRSSPSRMEEDLSEFREKASVSASCTCRRSGCLRSARGLGWGRPGPPERHRHVVRGAEIC